MQNRTQTRPADRCTSTNHRRGKITHRESPSRQRQRIDNRFPSFPGVELKAAGVSSFHSCSLWNLLATSKRMERKYLSKKNSGCLSPVRPCSVDSVPHGSTTACSSAPKGAKQVRPGQSEAAKPRSVALGSALPRRIRSRAALGPPPPWLARRPRALTPSDDATSTTKHHGGASWRGGDATRRGASRLRRCNPPRANPYFLEFKRSPKNSRKTAKTRRKRNSRFWLHDEIDSQEFENSSLEAGGEWSSD